MRASPTLIPKERIRTEEEMEESFRLILHSYGSYEMEELLMKIFLWLMKDLIFGLPSRFSEYLYLSATLN